MSDYVYQHGFSQMHAGEMYDGERRKQKAMKTMAVLGDYLDRAGRDPADMTLLDIGCSTGFLSQIYGTLFGRVIGVDIDAEAVDFARRTHGEVETTGEVRVDDDKIGRMGFWTPPTDENRAIRKVEAETFPTTAQFGNITMETELLGIYRSNLYP